MHEQDFLILVINSGDSFLLAVVVFTRREHVNVACLEPT
jgi:hypothetical protein